MLTSVARVVAAAVLILSGAVMGAGSASADQGTFAWTKITTPSKTFTYHFDSSEGAVNHLTVSGTAIKEADVTSLNILCLHAQPGGVGLQAATLASDVPVTNGSFTVQASVPGAIGVCRLRALPTNLDPSVPYVGSFSGPIMYSYTFGKFKDGSKTVAFAALDAFGSGLAAVADPSACAVAGLATVSLPDVQQRGPASPMCAFGMHPFNLTDTGTPTASAVRVDGKNAYLPGAVSQYLRSPGQLGLTLTQPSITASYSRNSATGDMTVTETARLWRCNGDNTFPPTAESCSSLVQTGVTFKQVLNVVRGNHQVLIHHSYISNDGHAHTVNVQYQNVVAIAPYGAAGYIYPKHSNSFSRAAFDKVVTGFGTGPGTVLVRSDIFASSTDAQADTQALTWSRPPAKIQFDHTTTFLFAMPYTFHVAAAGTAKIGFAVSEAPLTADAKKLAAKAVAAL
jgi:hypothetical protein